MKHLLNSILNYKKLLKMLIQRVVFLNIFLSQFNWFFHRQILFLDISRAIELLEKLQMSGEVPATKLAALQKVLQSDFLNGSQWTFHLDNQKFLN